MIGVGLCCGNSGHELFSPSLLGAKIAGKGGGGCIATLCFVPQVAGLHQKLLPSYDGWCSVHRHMHADGAVHLQL